MGHGRVPDRVAPVRRDRRLLLAIGLERGLVEPTVWGYVGIRLDAALPHIVLDGIADNGLGSNLPRAFGGGQRLHLEGDFDRHFALWAPAGYEADALYIFTPDVMARFIDTASGLDVEIVDDWLFLYVDGGVDLEDPRTWQWLQDVVRVLSDRLDRWGRWRDARIASRPAVAGDAPASASASAPVSSMPPGVAPGGRRLSWGLPPGAIIALAAVPVAILAFAALAIGSMLGPLLSR